MIVSIIVKCNPDFPCFFGYLMSRNSSILAFVFKKTSIVNIGSFFSFISPNTPVISFGLTFGKHVFSALSYCVNLSLISSIL